MSKISELSDGGALQSTDYLIAVRSGGNVKVQPAGMTFSSATFTTVDINGGTIDGVTIGGSSAGAGSFTTLTASGVEVSLSASTGTYFEGGGTGDSAENRKLLITSSTTTNTGDTHTLNAESATGNIAFATTNTEHMRIDDSGNVGIGTSSPSGKLDVQGTLVISNNAGAYWTLDRDDSDGSLTFDDTGSEAMRIDSSQNLLVGTTDANVGNNSGGTDVGHNILSYGLAIHSTDNQASLILNRQSTDGVIADFKKDGATVGSIGCTGSDLYIGKAGGTGLYFGGGRISPMSNLSPADDAVDMGHPTDRFQDLYLSGGVYLGGTGAANLLDDYEEGTFTPTYEGSTTNPTVTYDGATAGWYTKVGNLVHVTCIIQTDSFSGGSGNLLIAGLPFAQDTSGTFPIGFAVCEGDFFSTNDPSLVSFSEQAFGASRIGLFTDFPAAGGTTVQCSDGSNSANANRVRFMFTYRTA